MSNVEKTDYILIASQGDIEIRDYSPMILAEVEVAGERREAIRKGFKVLADYIFGNNSSHGKSEKIPMTAPVMQEREGDKWKIRFVIPQHYSMETLPKPNSNQVHLIPSGAKRYAVIRFSGYVDSDKIQFHTDKLVAYAMAERLKAVGSVILAFYNPPWTLPLLRRNEIMIEIQVDR